MTDFPEQTCPECGRPFRHVVGGPGRRATYCSRLCQVRNLNRRRLVRVVRVHLEPAERAMLEREATNLGTSIDDYVERVVRDHLATQATDESELT